MSKNKSITIILAVKNGMPFLPTAINSFNEQTYSKKKLLVIYSDSTDETLDYLKKIKKKNITIIKDNISNNLFQSLNFAKKFVNSEYVGLLHSDDVFFNKNTLRDVVKLLKKKDVIYGGVLISDKYNLNKIHRCWPPRKLSPQDIKLGFMPPHPSIFLSNKIFQNYNYPKKYKISGDYDYIIKIFLNTKVRFALYNNYTHIMRIGGASSKNIKNLLLKSIEDIKILKNNNLNYWPLIIVIKNLSKIPQFFYFKPKINFKKIPNFKIVENFNKIFKNKNFVFLAFNLAFLGFFKKFYLINTKNFIWLDGSIGVFVLKYIFNQENIKKNSSRLLFFEPIPKDIKNIFIIGNLSKIENEFLRQKYKQQIIFYPLSYNTEENLLKKISHIKLTAEDLVLITMPTPIQEIIALKLANRFKNYKIICIGETLRKAAGIGKKIPNYLIHFELLCRLQFDFKRRLKRLIYTLVLCFYNIISGKMKNFNIEK